jgi:hypothetical protein
MLAFIVTLALTLYMTGVIWEMHVLEYPLFALVGPQEFPTYHARHNRGLPFVVILPSLGAFVSAVVLIVLRPAHIPLWASVIVAALDLAIIGITVGREAPLHGRLDREGYQRNLIQSLINGNWPRTILWTINAVILLYVTALIAMATP